MIQLNGVEVKPTIFPDRTSQVWHLGSNIHPSRNFVKWIFEHEGELIQIAQLRELLPGKTELSMPYVPYARQDKAISDAATFALAPFVKIIQSLKFDIVNCFDVHNPKAIPKEWVNFNARPEIGITFTIIGMVISWHWLWDWSKKHRIR